MNNDDAERREAQRRADEQKRQADNERMRQQQAEKDARYQADKQKTRDAMAGGGGCFPKGTKITTPSGLKDIAVIREGEYVVAIDTKTNKKQNRKILKKLTHSNNKIWSIGFINGSSIQTTSIHSFFVNGKWKKASDIMPNDSVSSYDNGEYVERIVKTSAKSSKVENVYNIIVEDNFNFIADGLLAQSFSHFRKARILFWKIYNSIDLISHKVVILTKLKRTSK